jgi:hypothetical protein
MATSKAPGGTLPPGYSTSHTGDVHDFDYFVGGWITKQLRLKARGVGSSDWEVRYIWDKIDRDHARWQQAFSYDNRTWETNWIGDFTRADPSKICENGRPKRS